MTQATLAALTAARDTAKEQKDFAQAGMLQTIIASDNPQTEFELMTIMRDFTKDQMNVLSAKIAEVESKNN